MIKKNFKASKKNAYQVCLQVLTNLECDINFDNFETGKIEAKKGTSLLSFGHIIKISIRQINNSDVAISISSDSLGIQILDWGTNSENEIEIIDLITQNI